MSSLGWPGNFLVAPQRFENAMTDAAAGSALGNPILAEQRGRAYMHALASKAYIAVAWLWIFSGGFILFEPSFYEFLFLVTLCMGLAARMRLFSSTAPLLLLIMPFSVFGLIAAFQVRYTPLTDAIIFVLVTIYLLFTVFFIANFVAEAPRQRMAVVRRAYVAVAVVSAAIGILAYLKVLPNAELFLRYDRAKAMFKDPNVYGPFLILPAMWVLRDVFFHRQRQLLNGAIVLLLMIGVFVSFSRAAWGHFAFSGLLVFALCFWLEARAREKVRMLTIALVGGLVVVIAFAGLLSIPEIGSLFEQRASATQAYDTGSTGRFGRQGYAFDLALTHPWGLGPTEFPHLRIQEQPHNTYVTVLHAYGWGGGLCYYVLAILTLRRGLQGLKDPTRRALLIPVIAVYIPLVLQSAIIDTDHWRHYFLVMGLIWGITANTVDPAPIGQRGIKPPRRKPRVVPSRLASTKIKQRPDLKVGAIRPLVLRPRHWLPIARKRPTGGSYSGS